jgi:hypothetical protein
MWVWGFVAFVVGLPFLIAAAVFRKNWLAMRDVETFSCGRLAELSRQVAPGARPGGFQQPCEVVGAASLAGGRTLRAPESGSECVWYRKRVTEGYWGHERDSSGRRRRKKKTRILSEDDSSEPIRVDDGTGAMTVYPRSLEVDGAVKTADRVDVTESSISERLEHFATDVPHGTRASLRHEEWIIPPGARLYVLGVATDMRGELSLEKPANYPLLVSTRSEAAFLGKERAKTLLLGIPAVILVGAGLVAMALDIFI